MRSERVKRAYDLVLSVAGLAVLSPVFAVVAAAVKLGDRGPALFAQERIGRYGRPFRVLKFRTMVPEAERRGLLLTAGGDARITPVGRWLRRYKLDELPQLWNVVRGEMSLVGPRPEVPRYVESYTDAQREVLAFRPGITDLATLEYGDEEGILCAADDIERVYLTVCLPRKLALSLDYALRASVWEDTKIILRTLIQPLDRAYRSSSRIYRRSPGPSKEALASQHSDLGDES